MEQRNTEAFSCFPPVNSITAPKRLSPGLSCAANTAAPTCSGEPCSHDDVIHSKDGPMTLPQPEGDGWALSRSWKMLVFNVKSSVQSKTNQSQTTSKYLQLDSKMVSRCFGFFFISGRLVRLDVILNLSEFTFCCGVAETVRGGRVSVLKKRCENHYTFIALIIPTKPFFFCL